MSEPQNDRSKDIGVYGMYRRPDPAPRLTVIEIVAAVLTVLWLGVTLLGWGNAEGEGQGALLTIVVALLPVALIWVAAMTARAIRSMRQEASHLHSTIEAMRLAHLAQQQAAPVRSSTSRAAAPPAPGKGTEAQAQDQSAPSASDMGMHDLVRALDFPDSAEDEEGIRALRHALEDPSAARLVRAAQDVLTLLAEEGIYMDDLTPNPAPPEIWRRFAQGERGGAIAVMGGIENKEAIAVADYRMQQDPVFHDAAHHFLRTFDRTFASFEPEATDQEIAELSATRTACAFMLLGQAARTFG